MLWERAFCPFGQSSGRDARRSCGAGRRKGLRRVPPRAHPHGAAPIHFAGTNFPSGNARKTGGFAGRGKTSNFFEKFACIGNPLLVSYSPVAPLRATPGATRRSIFEKRTVLKNAIPRFPAREPSEGTRNTMNRYACCDARNPARGFRNLNKFFF